MQVLPPLFKSLLSQHGRHRIIFRHGIEQWNIIVNDNSLGAGCDEYCEQNIAKEHHILLLQHTGNLFFDVINFCELQQQVNLGWIVPLTSLHL